MGLAATLYGKGLRNINKFKGGSIIELQTEMFACSALMTSFDNELCGQNMTHAYIIWVFWIQTSNSHTTGLD